MIPLFFLFFYIIIGLSFSSNLEDFYPSGRNPNTELSFNEFLRRRSLEKNPYNGTYVKFSVNKEHVENGDKKDLIYEHTRIGILEPISFPRGNCLRVNNPLGHVSFEITNVTVGRRCSDVAKNKKCLFATNAGFYNRKTFIPFGTVISEGKIIHDNYQMNTMFGITKKGEYIIGYPSEKVLLELDFEVLITGIYWLVRDKTNFAHISGKYEGISDSQSHELSARTAIGHDAKGNLMLFQIDGKTRRAGYGISDFAEKLIKYGFVNAVNLDGGGSVTFIEGSKLVNSVTDSCSEYGLGNHEYEMCERLLSTAICFHNHGVVHTLDKELEEGLVIPCNQTCEEEGVIEGKDVVYVVGIFLLLVLLIFSFTVNAGLMVVLKKVQDRSSTGEAHFQIIESDDTDTESSLNDQFLESNEGNNIIYDSNGQLN